MRKLFRQMSFYSNRVTCARHLFEFVCCGCGCVCVHNIISVATLLHATHRLSEFHSCRRFFL